MEPNPSDADAPPEGRRIERSREPKHYQFLDALRGIAVLGVVAVHTTQNFHAAWGESVLGLGQYGVHLFYIVSAFSLCLSLDQRTKSERHPLLNYSLRRFFRIAPLFYLAIVVYLLDPVVLAPETWKGYVTWPERPWHVAATFLFVNGWHYQSINLIVPGGWSVAVETNFYLALPFLLRYAASLKQAVKLFGVTLVGYVVFRKVGYLLFGSHIPPRDVYGFGGYWSMSPPSQLPVFTLGIIMFHLFRFLRSAGSTFPRVNLRATYLGLTLAVLVALVAPERLNKILPDWVRIAVVLLFFCLLLAQKSYPLFVNGATVLLGKISFSIYLSHFIALQLIHWVNRTWYAPRFQSTLPFNLAFPCVLALAILMSIATYRLVEVPGQGLGRRLIRRLEQRPS